MQVLLDRIVWLKENLDSLFIEVLSEPNFQQFILDLVRINQLYQKGIDGAGQQLGNYSWATLNVYGKVDPMIAHITLKETGGFYKSFFLKFEKSSFNISVADYDVSRKLLARFNKNEKLLSLTPESIDQLISKIQPLFIAKILEKW